MSKATTSPKPNPQSVGESKSKKRSFNQVDGGVSDLTTGASKSRKVHPFFQKCEEPKGNSAFQWLPPLGPTGSCLHAINLAPANSSKVAVFDLDGTLIKADIRNQSSEWQWWSPVVPRKLQELHESGYHIVIVSNQALKPLPLKKWKEKVEKIANVLKLPFRLFAATAKDQYRKPMPGMWYELENICSKEGVEIDKGQSFFVGDAAGRIYSKSKSDFASTDRKWALNLQLPFQTPEEFFLNLPTHPNFALPGFCVSSLPELPLVLPSSSVFLPIPEIQELVLLVGPPCVGKTFFFRQHFKSAGYVHINQDSLKTRAKCISTTLDAIQRGESCVIDNTNRDPSTRKHYIDVAKKYRLPIRCFQFTAPIDLAWHNNLYRAFIQPSTDSERRSLLPYIAFTSFRDAFQEPALEEGFSEIKRVNWVFQGTDEVKEKWSMWLQIDGK